MHLWLKSNFTAVIAGCLLFLLLEGTFRLAGVSRLSDEDPFVGFTGSSPVFVPADGPQGSYHLNPAKAAYFNQQIFHMPKPTGEFRIVALGGSTTYGRPYLGATAFPEWLCQLLDRYAPGHLYENINAGGISYASYRVVRVIEEALDYQPDLVVFYSGHNEFLEARTFADLKNESGWLRRTRGVLHYSALYSFLTRTITAGKFFSRTPAKTVLGEEVEATIERIGGTELYHRDPVFRAGVIRQYEHSVREMVARARQRKVPLLLCTLPSNLAGVSPFKSEHGEGLVPADLARWNLLFASGREALAKADFSVALESLQAAERIDPAFALLHYLKGQALQALGREGEAFEAYMRAKEEDIVPLRAIEEFNEILRRIAAEENVPLADVAETFRRVSPGGIPGNNLFVDHVHPTIEGQQLVAWVILTTAAKSGLVPLDSPAWERAMPDAREFLRARDAGISPRYRAFGAWGVGRLYFWAGKYHEAYPALLEAWQVIRDKAEIPKELGQLEMGLFGRPREALSYLQAALAIEPDNEHIRMALANCYALLGDGPQALGLLDSLRTIAPPFRHYGRGEILRLLGRLPEAESELRKAAELAPEVPSLQLALAGVLNQMGKRTEAARSLRTWLDLCREPAAEQMLQAWEKGEWDPWGVATGMPPRPIL